MAGGESAHDRAWRRLKWAAGGIVLALGLALFIVTHIDTPAPYVEWQIPEHPVAKAAYDYAHSIKLPDSVPKPVPFNFCRYNILGLCFGKATDEEYFEHLCKTEAGEYVFKRVEGVEGIAELRPRRRAKTDGEALDRYALEDPLTWARDATFTPLTDEYLGLVFVQSSRAGYEFLDSRSSERGTDAITRFFRDENVDPDNKRATRNRDGTKDRWILNSKQISQSTARFEILLRGARRYRDREFGVAGSEVIILDRESGSVMAVRRDFAMSPWAKNGPHFVDWDRAKSCLRAHEFTSRDFVVSVLKPKGKN